MAETVATGKFRHLDSDMKQQGSTQLAVNADLQTIHSIVKHSPLHTRLCERRKPANGKPVYRRKESEECSLTNKINRRLWESSALIGWVSLLFSLHGIYYDNRLMLLFIDHYNSPWVDPGDSRARWVRLWTSAWTQWEFHRPLGENFAISDP